MSRPPSRGRAAGMLARLAASAAILAALLIWLPLDALGASVTAVPAGLWLGCVLAFLAGHVAGAFKWHLLLDLSEHGPRFFESLRYYFAGLFANLFLPSVAGGDVVRAGLAMRGRGGKQAVVFAGLVDRTIDTGTLVVFVIVGAGLSHRTLAGADAVVVAAVTLAMLAGVAAGIVALTLPLPHRLPERLRGLQGEMRSAAAALARERRRAAAALALSLGVQGSFVALNALLGRACGIELSAGAWLFAWPMAKLTAMIPISLAGIGVREAALAGLLGRFGVAAPAAVALGLLWETVLVTGSAAGGLFYASVRRSSRRAEVAAADV